jgi:hypothetical protein
LELRVGLAIGRIVFRALNVAEIGWAIVLGVCLLIHPQSVGITTLTGVAAGLLAVQLVLVRPRLNRRSDAVLTSPPGSAGPRSRAHHAYIALEILKVAALIVLACYLLAPS